MVFIIGLLKVIGFSLLFLVGFILFVSIIILFLPICYELNGSGPPYVGKVSVRWLFGLIRFHIGFRFKAIEYQLHIFHRTWPNMNPKKTKKSKRKKSYIKKNKMNEREQSLEIRTIKTEDIEKIQETSPKSTLSTKPMKKTSKEKSIIDKLKSLRNKVNKVWTMITEEENKAILKLSFKQLIYLLKRMKPTKVNAHLLFSTTDPATTGEILGALALIKWTYKNGVHIIPDFANDQYNLEGTVFMKGTIYGFDFLLVGIRLLKNKKIRDMLLHGR